MPAYEFCNFRGECFDEIYLSWKDAPKTIVKDTIIYHRQFPNPSVRFKGPFSGSTKNIVRPDDGSVVEAGTKEDTKKKQRYKKEKQDKARRDFLANEVQNYDV
jgi:hypothetical protein